MYDSIERETAFTLEDKMDALEQISILANAWIDECPKSSIRNAQIALHFLRGLTQEFAHAHLFNQACQQFLTPLMNLLNQRHL